MGLSVSEFSSGGVGGGGVLWKWVKCPLTLNMKIMGNEYLTHFEK